MEYSYLINTFGIFYKMFITAILPIAFEIDMCISGIYLHSTFDELMICAIHKGNIDDKKYGGKRTQK